jgi:hypothetical protein
MAEIIMKDQNIRGRIPLLPVLHRQVEAQVMAQDHQVQKVRTEEEGEIRKNRIRGIKEGVHLGKVKMIRKRIRL